jgi:hypothetical protein
MCECGMTSLAAEGASPVVRCCPLWRTCADAACVPPVRSNLAPLARAEPHRQCADGVGGRDAPGAAVQPTSPWECAARHGIWVLTHAPRATHHAGAPAGAGAPAPDRQPADLRAAAARRARLRRPARAAAVRQPDCRLVRARLWLSALHALCAWLPLTPARCGRSSVDALDAFPSLTETRLTGNPVVDANPNTRHEVVARVQRLTMLNGSLVGRAERRDAEIRYLRRALDEAGGAEAVAVAGAAAMEKHPRMAELMARSLSFLWACCVCCAACIDAP